MKTGSPLIVRYEGSTLNFPHSLTSSHSLFFLLLARQNLYTSSRIKATVALASARVVLRLESSPLASTTISRKSLSS